MNAADLFIQCLEAEGVKYVFGIPGEENLEIMEAIRSSKQIEFILCRHEQSAAFMADVYGRLTGDAGVCTATLGPGATNLVTGVADANMDNAPLVAIAGQAGTDRLHKESHQVLDLDDLFSSITKYSTSILMPETVPEVVRKAFKTARSEKPGASFIEFPENIADSPAPKGAHPVKQNVTLGVKACEEALNNAAKLIEEAQNPIILAGHGVIRSHSSEALTRFAETTKIPVANTFMAKGVIPFSHPQALGSVGLQAKDYVGVGFDKADLILCVGYDIVEYHPYLWHDDEKANIIHIDTTPAEVDAHYPVEAVVRGDIDYSLDALSELVSAKPESTLSNTLREHLIADMIQHKDDLSVPVKPQKLIWDLRTVLNSEDIVISDVGAHKMWLARMFRCEEPNTCLISNGFASMGIALPGAIAAKLIHPNRNIVAATGDAGFMMNVQEIETAVRLNTPIIILVWNDNSYGLIEWKQRTRFGHDTHVQFTNPDFVMLAESFGAKGLRVSDDYSLTQALNDAIASQEVCIIDCPVDYSENMKLTEKLGETVLKF